MNFLIYGAGALGQAIGCMLAADGHGVDFILRRKFIDAIAKDGLQTTGILGHFTATKDSFGLFPHLQDTTKTYDYALITTKTYDTLGAIEELWTIEKSIDNVVSMQNGCGNLELLEQKFGTNRSYGARVITGFAIPRPGWVNITVSADAIHIGGCRAGNIPQPAKELAAGIARAGHPCLAVSDIHQSLHAKLLYNCTLNPLGAVLGVHYGALGDQRETREIMDRVIDETFQVIEMLGGSFPWPDPGAYRQTFYSTLLPATYNHRPSMLQDLENHKPTEIDALTGYVSSQGKKANIPTPTCDLLTRLVRFKELTAAGDS